MLIITHLIFTFVYETAASLAELTTMDFPESSSFTIRTLLPLLTVGAIVEVRVFGDFCTKSGVLFLSLLLFAF